MADATVTVRDANERGNNLFGIGLLAVTGIALLPVALQEPEWADRADDLALLVLAVIGLAWYLTGRHRFRHSLVPVVLLGLAALTKAFAITVEFRDPASVGDDLGVILVFLIGLVVAVWLYWRAGRTA